MSIIPWTEIESFHNIRKYASAYPEILNGTSDVVYLSKVKLHGMNMGVQVYPDGRVITQSRSAVLSIAAGRELTLSTDVAGFARWVADHEDWRYVHSTGGIIIFGEWCGPGVQKSVAVSNIPNKIFAVFAARFLDDEDSLIVEPAQLRYILKDVMSHVPEVHVLDWYSRDGEDAEITVDWSKSDAELSPVVEEINRWVMEVEQNDPWVEKTFGVKGTGEGLVFYPRVRAEHVGLKNFNNLTFKAKGEKHRVIKTEAPAQLSAEAAASVDQFVELVLTTPRLEQGATAVAGSLTFDVKLTGKFVAWIVQDVAKETQDELAASSLDWKQVQKPISDKARTWYLSQAKGK
jgi:hypothetical protein